MSLSLENTLILLYTRVLLFIGNVKESLVKQSDNQKLKLFAGPLVFIVVVIAVVFVAWALGQTICWATTGKDFVFATKLKEGEFRLGCQ